MKLFDIAPDYPYYLGIVLMTFCLLISIIDKRLNKEVNYDDDMDHSGHAV